MKSKHFLHALAILFMACNNSSDQPVKEKKESIGEWSILPFTKIDSVNPVMKPDPGSIFNCPVLRAPVKWEEKDVFNPAAIVRNDTVFLLYRAEDKIGKYAGT